MSKRTSVAPTTTQHAAAPMQEAPATPIKAISSAAAVPLPANTSPFVGIATEHAARKPSAATLEAPFSSINIADAAGADSDEANTRATVHRASITKTRTGKPMEDTNEQLPKVDENAGRSEDASKRTRRGGKPRKKEITVQERRNGGDLQSSPQPARKGYVLNGLIQNSKCPYTF